METFCEDTFLDVNQSWNTSTPVLSSCLSRSLLILPSFTCSIISLLYTLFLSTRSGFVKRSWSWILLLRIILLISALVCIIAQASMEFKTSLLYLVDALFFGVNIQIVVISLIVQVLLKSRGSYSAPFQFFLWLFQVIFLIPNLLLPALEPAFIAYYIISCLLLISEWFPNWRTEKPSENTSSFPSWLYFSWESSTFFRGYKHLLTYEDLPEPNKLIDIDRVTKKFNQVNEQDTQAQTDSKRKRKKSIMKLLIKSFGGTFITGALLRLLNDILLYATPQVFRRLLHVIETDDHAWKGYFWVVILLITATTQVTISNHYFRQTYVAAFQMRSAVITAIYKKTLTISNVERREFSTGEITNLMSIDSQRFLEIVPFLNSLWSGPFQFALAFYFLYDLLGISAFIGLSVFFLLVPVNLLGGKYGRSIQARQMIAKDKRILFMNEILQGMKVLKLYAWEKPFMNKINEHRKDEIHSFIRNAVIQAFLWITFTAAPLIVILITFICYVYIDPENNVLNAETVFGTVAIVNVVRIPMNQFPRFVMESVKLWVSVKRIDKFFNCEDLEEESDPFENTTDPLTAIEMKNADFSWVGKTANPTLGDINLNIKKGELVAVVGKIGSGKSSFLSAILGEMQKVGGSKTINGQVSYVAQQAWIQNLTVRDNILFGNGFEPLNYDNVIYNCALKSDLEILPNGDLTEIGENGVNLSGGQKQRVGLARAAYSGADIVLMDDPLSAVDAHVSKHIFDNLIGPKGFLSNRTRILVTHSLGVLHKVDRILLFHDGRIVDQGTLEELQNKKSEFFQEMEKFVGKEESEEAPEIAKTAEKETKNKNDGKLIEQEKSSEGRVSLKHYIFYLKSMNMGLFFIVLFIFMSAEAFLVGGNLILSSWTSNYNPETNAKYIGLYALMGALCSVCGMLSHIGIGYRGAAASDKLHRAMLEKTMHAPLSFFESNPIGRILNRFTSDLDVIDQKIPNQLRQFLGCVFMIVGTFLVVSSITPMFLVTLIPIIIIYTFLQIYYTRTRRQVKRLESVAKSPIYSHFTESITGATTIRAFGQTRRFCKDSEDRVAKHLQCNYMSEMTNRWLSIRVEILGNIIVFLAAIMSFYYRESISPGLAGLSISYSMVMIDGFGWTVRMAGELESDSIALERVREYEELPQENNWETEGGLDNVWPEQGKIVFDKYSTKYREELPNVLDDFTLEIQDQEKLGIVGRTGAGKSSLSLALFRILEPGAGTIRIDGTDIGLVGLQDLRSRITIIPQDPTLFSGSLRFNLDPGEEYPDAQLEEALRKSGLSLEFTLDQHLSEGGLGLSLGQRQLVCLARALLRKSKILILDEATAAVDAATDQRIQETIRKEFKDCTVVTIAHRLHTITGGDRVLVLDQGRVVEQGPPQTLLADSTSRFYLMAKAAGLVTDQEKD